MVPVPQTMNDFVVPCGTGSPLAQAQFTNCTRTPPSCVVFKENMFPFWISIIGLTSASFGLATNQSCEADTSNSVLMQRPRKETSEGSRNVFAEPCKIFTYWEYKHVPPLFTRLNVEAWRRHTKGLCSEPILINNQTIRDWVPDMPDEFFRMPYTQATSDLVRYGVLYHHGGIYMDSDFIVLKDLSPVVQRLDHDLVSYCVRSNPGNICTSCFSSNFLASRKGSHVMKEMWEKQKAKIRDHCPLSEKEEQKVCCFDDPNQKCHIPWGGIGEGTTHKVMAQLLKDETPMKTYCFADEEAFVPSMFRYVLEHVTNLTAATHLLESHGIKKGLDRMAFHLFNSIMPFSKHDCKTLFAEGTTVGHLFRTAFGGSGRLARPSSPETEAFLAKHPEFAELQKSYEGGWPCKLE